ncbi:MAG: M15 family metallopeptidase [Bacteroidota bacterium]|nr:M15 family metallopeptidase [Bacteroidota bacterium]
MFHEKFPVAHAIPVVKYHWDDDASMQANNTYSFCYRDISFSKHARGMAIDINPYFNPVRWKKGYEGHLNKPSGAHFNASIPGTFYRLNPVVQEFKKLGFRWGHNFTMKFDDHHFEI